MKSSNKLLFFILVLTCSVSIQAADFSAGNIYYNITGENTVEVTSLSPGSYSGNIEIPGSVDYEGTTYQVTAIGNSTFLFCMGLTSVVIPNTVESIGDGAFFACANLSSIILPEGLKYIGNESFSSCIKFTSLTIPQSVLSIGNSAFASCAGLTEIFVSWDNPAAVTYGNTVFNGVNTTNCKIKTGYNQPVLYEEIPTWSIFENIVEYNPDFIVNNEGELIQYVGSGGDIIIPTEVKSIGAEVFKNNTDITSVVIPTSVESIGTSAFSGCTALASVIIPESVNQIENYVFLGCTNLQDINVSWAEPKSLADGGNINYGSGLFMFVPTSCVVNVPAGLLADYNIYPWLYFDNIKNQGTPTNINQIIFSDVKIYAQNRTITVENATEPVFIYNILGSRIVTGGNGKFKMPNIGIYVVKTGKTVKKIIVKD